MTDEFLKATLQVLGKVNQENRFEKFVPRGLTLLAAKNLIFRFPETLLTQPEREIVTRKVEEMIIKEEQK